MKTVLELEAGIDTQFRPMGLEEIVGQFDFARSPRTDLSDEWYWHCQMEDLCVYEYPVQEYVGTLATHLASMAEEVDKKEGEPLRVLEVAAGQGLLSLCIARNLQDMGVNSEVIAVDDHSWVRTGRYFSMAEKVDYREAVPEYKPHVIIGAWIPASRETVIDSWRREFVDEDWTKVFRHNPRTHEYILIGKAESPNRHASPAAWGLRYNRNTTREEAVEVPEYEQDGFTRIDMDEWRDTQLCYKSHVDDMHQSLTVCFRRSS